MQTIQQKRATFALKQVKDASHNPKVNQKEYKSHAAGLPAMIHMNGLGQAAAFYKSKSEEHVRLYNLLSEWLTQKGQPYYAIKTDDDGKEVGQRTDLLEGITEENMHRYRLAQAEAQALMDWVKKFASAYMAEA